jgi:hypothetical protein
MFDYQTVKLLHRHGDHDWSPYVEGSDHDVAAHDPERSWLKAGARIFKCSNCADEVMVVPAAEPGGESSGSKA